MRRSTIALTLAAFGALLAAGRAVAQDGSGRWLVHLQPSAAASAHATAAAAAARARRADPELAAAWRAQVAADAAATTAAIAAHGGTVDALLVAPPALVVTFATAPTLADLPGAIRLEPARHLTAHTGDATSSANHAATTAHAAGTTGSGRLLALFDTGVELQFQGSQAPHPAFLDAQGVSRVVHSWSVQGSALSDRSDQHGHGTGVAAVAAGRRWSQNPQIADGFAPDARLATYRITRGTGDLATTADLAAAYNQALLDKVAGLPIDAANCSFGGSPDPTAADQQALDTLAAVGDVLVVVSAGNLTLPPNLDHRPTEGSQAASNGLAVGAVVKSSHAVAPFSAYGPLHGAGERAYPDLAAVGQAVRTALRTSTGYTTVDGTSYAAPMVAGTALLVRQVRPDLDARTVKALLLGSATDLQAANPGRDERHFGQGLLRTDRAIASAQRLLAGPGTVDAATGRRLTGSLGTGQSLAFPLPTSGGGSLRATLVWNRPQAGASDLGDLDLELRDGQGRLLGLGNRRASTYERLVAPATGGTVTATVRAVAVPAPLDFVLVVDLDAPAPASPALLDLGGGCPGNGRDHAAAAVLPAVPGFGDGRTNKPLADAPLTFLAGYDLGGLSGPRSVTTLGLRRAAHEGATASFAVRLRLTLGYTSRAANDLLSPPAANFAASPAAAVVFDGWLPLRATGPEPAAAEFDVQVPLTVPWLLDPAAGTALVQFEVLGNDRGNQPQPFGLDAVRVTTGASLGGLVQFQGAPFAVAVPERPVLAFGEDGRRGVLPRLVVGGAPRLGATVPLVVRDGVPLGLLAVLVGSPVASGGLSLPLDLGGFGAPGCVLLAGVDASALVVLDGVGQGEAALVVPTAAGLVGVLQHVQGVAWDAAANGLGLVVTGGVGIFVGG